MMSAAAAAEIKSNIGHDTAMLDAFDPEYLDTDEAAEDWATARLTPQENLLMAEWFGIA